MVGIEHHHRVIQQIVLFQAFHQFSHEFVRFHGMRYGIGVLFHIVIGALHLVLLYCRFCLFHVWIGNVAEILRIRSVAGIGDQEAEERIVTDHFVVAADHLAVQHIVRHVHGVHIVIGFKAKIGMNGSPAVDLSAGGMEGVRRISAVTELVGQTQRKRMRGIGIAADPLFGRNESRLGQDLRIERCCRQKQRCIEVFKIDPFLLYLIQVRCVLLGDHPAVHGFHHHHDQVFSLHDSGHLILTADLRGTLIIKTVQCRHIDSVGVVPQCHLCVAVSILIQPRHHEATVGIRKEPICLGFGLTVINLIPGHMIIIRKHVFMLLMDGKQRSSRQKQKDQRADPFHYPGPCLPSGKTARQDHQ